MKKTFVLDTNVLLHDPTSIFNFDEHDLVIPIIVLEELDKFKKGSDWVNQNARAFVRTLSKLSDASIDKSILSLGEQKGNLTVPIDGFTISNTNPLFANPSVDNQLLAYCLNNKGVIFVTKDINLRMKARSLGLEAQDYENECVLDPAQLSPGYRIVNDVPQMLIDLIYNESEVYLDAVSHLIESPKQNEYYVFKAGQQSVITQVQDLKLVRTLDNKVSGITAKNLEQTLAIDLLLNPNIPLVALTGLSGSGKTLLSLAAAIAQRRNYLQIFLTRPIVPLGNDIGFLPGDIMEKLDPYMQPLYDNLEVIKKSSANDAKLIKEMQETEKIKILALPYLRGRSLPRIFFIIDEAQNLTPHEVKTIVTRAGEGAKIVFTGDIDQIDSPYMDARSNGLSHLIHKMKDQKLFWHVHLVKGERSKLAELASKLL
jgi:PhoH-like ATPase